MNKLEKYLIENESFLQACNDYISNGEIIVAKHFIFSKVMRYFKTTDIDICKKANVPYEKGEPYELPNYVMLKKK